MKEYNYAKLTLIFSALTVMLIWVGIKAMYMQSMGIGLFLMFFGVFIAYTTFNYAKAPVAQNPKKGKVRIILRACIGIIIGIVLTSFIINTFINGGGSSSDYDDVWDKHPNEWSDDEAEYVDGFFDWMDKQNED